MTAKQQVITEQKFRQRYKRLMTDCMRANPHFQKTALRGFLCVLARTLRKCIADPENGAVSWESPSVGFNMQLFVNLENSEPLSDSAPVRQAYYESPIWPCYMTSESLRNWQTVDESLVRNLYRQKLVWAAREVHSGVLLVWQGDSGIVVFGPKDYIKRLFARRRSGTTKMFEAMLEPAVPFVISGVVPNTDSEESGQFAWRAEFDFRPIVINTKTGESFLPVGLTLRTEEGSFTAWGQGSRNAIWGTLIQTIEQRYPEEGLEAERQFREATKLAEIDFSFSIKSDYAEDFRNFIKSFGELQVQHVHTTGKFAQIQGVLKMSEIGTPLTEQQQLDYKTYEYKCHDKVWIRGSIPIKRSNIVEINGNEVQIGDNLLALLLRLIHELKKGKGGWMPRRPLPTEAVTGPYDTYQMYSNLRTAIEGSLQVKDGALFIECDGSKRYRISTHPDFVTYDKKKLLKHPLAIVKKLAGKLP